jgi:hypothetical protein
MNSSPHPKKSDLSKTLWIGDIEPWWTKHYIESLFEPKGTLFLFGNS